MSLFEGFYDLIVRLQMLFYAHMAPLFNKLDLSDALTTGAIILGLMTVKGLYRYVQVQMVSYVKSDGSSLLARKPAWR